MLEKIIDFIDEWAPLILLAVLIAAGFGAGWTANGWRLSASVAALKQAQAEEIVAAERAARQIEQGWNANYREAVKNHAASLEKLQADRARARADAVRLRDDIAALERQLSASADAACGAVGNAALDVFGACVAEYLEVAAKADECDLDARALIDAWPSGSGIGGRDWVPPPSPSRGGAGGGDGVQKTETGEGEIDGNE